MLWVLLFGLMVVALLVHVAIQARRAGNRIVFWVSLVVAILIAAGCVPVAILLVALLTGPPLTW